MTTKKEIAKFDKFSVGQSSHIYLDGLDFRILDLLFSAECEHGGEKIKADKYTILELVRTLKTQYKTAKIHLNRLLDLKAIEIKLFSDNRKEISITERGRKIWDLFRTFEENDSSKLHRGQ